MAETISAWCSGVLLGGKPRNLKVSRDAVFQFPSVNLNHLTYGVPISDPDLVRQIVLDSSPREKEIESNIGAVLGDLDITGGLLLLQRAIRRLSEHEAERRVPREIQELLSGKEILTLLSRRNLTLPELRRQLVRSRKISEDLAPTVRLLYDLWLLRQQIHVVDRYRLLVYVEGRPVPLLVVWPRYLSAFRTAFNTSETVTHFQAALQRPRAMQLHTDVILSWHDLAQYASVNRSRIYLRACIHEISRLVGHFDDASTNPVWWHSFDVAFVGFEQQPTPTPVHRDYPKFPYSAEAVSQAGFSFPAFELQRRYPKLKIKRLYDLRGGKREVVSDYLPFQTHFGGHQTDFDIGEDYEYQEEEFRVPQPTGVPNGLLGDVTIKFLRQAFSNSADYVGGGNFRVRSADLTRLAAGTGAWGSPELLPLTLTQTAEWGIASTAGAGGAVGGGIWLVSRGLETLFEEEIQEELQGCYEMPPEKCQDCVSGSMAMDVNRMRLMGDAIAGVSALAGFAIASGPLAALAAVVGVIVIAVVLAEDIEEQRKLDDPCERAVG